MANKNVCALVKLSMSNLVKNKVRVKVSTENGETYIEEERMSGRFSFL